jgi:hypothetical protein
LQISATTFVPLAPFLKVLRTKRECAAPGRRSSVRNDESETFVAPLLGHAKVYRLVSASYMVPL